MEVFNYTPLPIKLSKNDKRITINVADVSAIWPNSYIAGRVSVGSNITKNILAISKNNHIQ